MRKIVLSIIPLVALFALSSCGCQGPQRNYNSSEAEQKAEEYTSYTSYSLSTTLVLKGETKFSDSLTEGVAEISVVEKSKVDGLNAVSLPQESLTTTKETYPLDDIIKNSGNKSIAELKEAYPKYTFDEAKRTVSQETSSGSEKATKNKYYIYDQEYDQYKVLEFDSKDKLIASKYTNYDEYEDVQGNCFILHNLKDLIKETLVNGKPVNGEYILEPEGGINVSGTVLDKAHFKHDGTTMTLGGSLNGDVLGSGTILEAKIEVKATDLNKVKLTIPSGEVTCEHQHKFFKMDDLEVKGHRKMCYDCQKYLDKEIKPHDLSNKHKYCGVCDYHPDYESSYCPEELINKDGHKLMSVQYCKDTNEYIGSNYISTNSSYPPLFKESFPISDSKGGTNYVAYYEKDEIMIIVYQSGDRGYVNESSCVEETQYTFIAFKNVKFNITAEQQAVLDNEDSSSSDKKKVYLAGVGLSSDTNTIADIKNRYTLLKEFNTWYVYASHNSSSGEPVAINTCLTSTPSVCAKCGKTTYVNDVYSHDRHLNLVANPSWAQENCLYFQYDECSKCHEKDDSVYEVKEGDFSNHYNGYSGYATQYNIEGKKISTYVSIYILDHCDKDGECQLCHAKAISVGDVKVHVDRYGLAENTYNSDYPRWEYLSSDYQDGWTIQRYQKDEIVITLKSKSESNKVTYILEYNGVESSPLVFDLD